jgi:hypothetical protein
MNCQACNNLLTDYDLAFYESRLCLACLNAKILLTGEPESDSTEKVIPPYYPDDSDAEYRVPGWEAA